MPNRGRRGDCIIGISFWIINYRIFAPHYFSIVELKNHNESILWVGSQWRRHVFEREIKLRLQRSLWQGAHADAVVRLFPYNKSVTTARNSICTTLESYWCLPHRQRSKQNCEQARHTFKPRKLVLFETRHYQNMYDRSDIRLYVVGCQRLIPRIRGFSAFRRFFFKRNSTVHNLVSGRDHSDNGGEVHRNQVPWLSRFSFSE